MNLFLEVCRVCGNGDEFCTCQIRDKAAFIRAESQRRDIGRIATALERLTLMVTQLVMTGSATPALQMLESVDALLAPPEALPVAEEPKLLAEAAATSDAGEATLPKEEKKCKRHSGPRKR